MDTSCTAIVIFYAVFLLAGTRSAMGRQCFVCGIGAADPMYQTMRLATAAQLVATSNNTGNNTSNNTSSNSDLGNLAAADDTDRLSCESMEMADANLDAYLVECPAVWKGCFTQIDGTTAVSTCNRYPIDDCKMANGITYCYCNTDRCNRLDAPIVLSQNTPGPTKTVQSILSALGYRDPHELAQSPADEDDEGDDDFDRDEQFEASGKGDLWPPETTPAHVEIMSTTNLPTRHQTPRPRAHLTDNSGGWRPGGLSVVLACLPAYLLLRSHWV